jgi:hypothetical protein
VVARRPCCGLLGLLVAFAFSAYGSGNSQSASPGATDLTGQQLEFATRIAKSEITKQGSHIRLAVADMHHGFVRQSNTGHACDSGTLLRVTLIGSFPHTTVSPPPGHSATVTAEVVEADPSTGRECLIGVQTGHVHPPSGATRLSVSN